MRPFAGTVTVCSAAVSTTDCGVLFQGVLLTAGVSSRVKPDTVTGQEMTAWPLPRSLIFRRGAPGVCTTATPLQKPPSNLNCPLASAPASGCPTVPVIRNFPPALMAPPSSTVDHLRSNLPPLWAWEGNAFRASAASVRKHFVFIVCQG